MAWQLLDCFEAKLLIRVLSHQDLGGTGSRGSPGGGWRPTAISIAQIVIIRSRLSASAVIVPRRQGAKPRRRRPSTDYAKCSLQTCCQGLNRGTTGPLWGSWACYLDRFSAIAVKAG